VRSTASTANAMTSLRRYDQYPAAIRMISMLVSRILALLPFQFDLGNADALAHLTAHGAGPGGSARSVDTASRVELWHFGNAATFAAGRW